MIELPANATAAEVERARRRASVRRGNETYLPYRNAETTPLPNQFLNASLFSASSAVQAGSQALIDGDSGSLVQGKEIAGPPDQTLILTGYELCQLDLEVYARCLAYYQNRPLASDLSPKINVSVYQFITSMNRTYGLGPHKAVWSSLYRLSHAQLNLRYRGISTDLPKLVTVQLIGSDSRALKGSDQLHFAIPDGIGEYFSSGRWTAVDKTAIAYGGIKGWLASFLASGESQASLELQELLAMSGYRSHMGNFRKQLARAFDELRAEATPVGSRISSYIFFDSNNKVSYEKYR